MFDRSLVFDGFERRRNNLLLDDRPRLTLHNLNVVDYDLVLDCRLFFVLDSLGWFFVSFETIE